MGTELYSDEFGRIIHHGARSVLELEWSEGTASMTDEDVKEWLERYTSFAETHHPAYLLIDARRFRHRFDAKLSSWREAYIIPRYNAAEVRKLAFLLPKEFHPGGEPAPETGAIFPTGYFASPEEVDEWFGA